MLMLSRLLSIINSPRQLRFFIIPYKAAYVPVLKQLLKGGVILSYYTVGKQYFGISTRGLRSGFRPIKHQMISFSDLKKLQYREGGVTSYMLYTDRGLCSSNLAISQHLGGKLVLKSV
jgi:ribosomal protein S8